MQKLSKFVFFLFLVSIPFLIGMDFVKAQDKPDTGTANSHSDPEAYPGIKFPCDETNAPDPDFNSLRPYQGAPCGSANRALYCSNDIQFIETFNLTDKCPRNGNTSDFWCPVNHKVPPHTLFIELTGSMFPIMGNTEEVKNSQGGTEQYDDARKVNEYASWYLSGVNNRAEYGENTNERVVNYSGPVQKLLPKTIQEAQRIETIKSKDTVVLYIDDDGNPKEETSNHDQVVVCGEEEILGILGKTQPRPCYDGSRQYRLSDWDGSLSLPTEIVNNNIDIVNGVVNGLLGGVFSSALNSIGVNTQIDEVWNKKTPPLPWDDGTVEGDGEKIPFKSDALYRKAYNEWQGKSCVILPIAGLFCLDNPLVSNKYADLYQYIPLSNTTDKGGSNYILGDGPDIQPGSGTKLLGDNPDEGTDDAYTKPQFSRFRNAPLYFAHTQEVKESSELLNKTYIPGGYKGDKDAVNANKTVEANACSSVNVRTNKGDHLFPGDDDEMQIIDLEYTIEEVLCKVETTTGEVCKDKNKDGDANDPGECLFDLIYTHRCNAEVYITIHTGTKTPWANEIFDTTVAGSASTFRKIFPKVEENAPVECIADIPTVTKVNYDRSRSERPQGGDQTSKVIKYPEDGSGSGPELTFPHVGSIYEYFLQGIQTALRPKGYGAPIANGNCVTTETGACRQWLFEKDNQGKYYYDKIIETALATRCNGKSLNPFWAVGIALNENGGLMTDNVEGFSNSHFGCNMTEIQSIDDKINCMANTLRRDCLEGKTDEEALGEYGYLPGYVLWPVTVLDPGGSYPPPLFGSGFNTSQLVTNLLNADWKSTYESVATIFCPSSPTLPR